MKNKALIYKPVGPFKLVNGYWWNPLFWVVVVIFPFASFFTCGAVAFWNSTCDLYNEYKLWDLK